VDRSTEAGDAGLALNQKGISMKLSTIVYVWLSAFLIIASLVLVFVLVHSNGLLQYEPRT
jgi:hypothetical protein